MRPPVIRPPVVVAAVLLCIAAPRAFAQLPLALPLEIRLHRPGAFVHAVAQSRDGHLWIGTEAGAFRFDGTALTRMNEVSVAPIHHALGDASGGVWLASRGNDGVVIRVGGGGVRVYGAAEGVPGGRIAGFGLAPDGAAWVTTHAGLARFTGERWQRVVDGVPVPLNPGPFLRGADGALWLRSGGTWLRLAPDGVAERRAQASDSDVPADLAIAGAAPAPSARAIAAAGGMQARTTLVDRAGTVYVGTAHGLFVGTPTHAFRLGVEEGLPDHHIRRLFEDAEGGIWAVTHGGGLAQLVRRPVASVTVRHGLKGNTPFGVTQTDDGVVWVTTVAGLNRLDPDGTITLAAASHPKVQMRNILAARDGALWVSTNEGPVLRYDRGTDRFAVHPLPDRIANEYTSALGETDEGLVIATMTGRVLVLQAGRFRQVRAHAAACVPRNTNERSCGAAVSALIPRRAGGLWAPTFRDGLAVFEGAALRPSGISAPRTTLWSVHEEESGRLWIGADDGLYLHAGGRTRPIRAADGDRLDPVFHVLQAGDGALWIGGLRGVTRLEPAPEDQARRALRYTMADALPSDLVMGIADPTAMRARDGRIWFVTVTGLAVFEPTPPPRPPAPAPHFERVDSDSGRFRFPLVPATVSLPPGRGELMVTYGAAVLGDPHRVRFAYRLEGVDSRWTEAGERRVAHYANLDPGRYTFRVRAFRDDAPDTARESAIAVVLAPRFHQTPLFFALMTVAAALVVGGGVVLRLRHLRARFVAVLDERRRIARDLHDTLAQIFAAIGFQTSALLDEARTPAERHALAEQLRRIVAHGRRAARGVVWNLRTSGGDARSLERALEELTGMYEGARVSLAVSGDAYALALERETDVLYIAQQAVSNAIEHGQARHVGIELEYAPDRFALWVRDDGKGMPAEPPAEAGHYGMATMRERAERVGGTLVVESAPEAGTEVGVVIERPGGKEKNR